MEFKEFRIEDLFEVKTTKGLDEGKLTFSESGNYNFVGRTKKNNGVKGRISKQSFDANAKNTISVSQIGTITACYQPEEWYGSQNMFCLTSKNELTKNKYLYFVAVLNAYLRQYANSGRSVYPTLTSLKNAKIQLPVTPSGEIDFDYMEQYIEKIEKQYVEKIEKQYIEKITLMLKASGLDNYQLTEEENSILKEEKEKKEFRVGDLFEQERGKEKAPNQAEPGDCQLVNETSTNNGWTKLVKPTKRFAGNAITISINFASTVFYQPKEFCASVNIAILRNKWLNYKRALYIVTLLKKQFVIYDYNNKISKDKINDTKISLPVTPSGEIDFDYMEKYISAIIKTKIKNVVLEINKKLELYKQTQN